MTDKPNYSLKGLLNELKEKEKGCGTRLPNFKEQKIICGMIHKNNNIGKILCPVCRAEISALKKGISACEEVQKDILDRMYRLLKEKKCHCKGFISETEECFDREWNECKQQLNLNNTSTNLNLNKGCEKECGIGKVMKCGEINHFTNTPYLCDDCRKAVKDD